MSVAAHAVAADALARVEALFKDAAADAPGCAVGVVHDGETLLATGYGLASLEHGVAITPTTRFYMASVSKQVTALAVLLAAQRGCLGVDDGVRGLFPELPPCMDAVTIRHLLTHTGGVRDYFSLAFLAGLPAEHTYTEREVLEILGRQRALNFQPGEDCLYSNSGYVLLAMAIERASGKRLDDFARETIFGPLGMTTARFQHDHGAIVPDKAFSYDRSSGQWRVAVSMLDVVGDGGMYASLTDMLAWTRNLLSPRIGAQAIALMQAPARLASGASTRYGMGLGVGLHRGLATVEHGGGLAGYRTHLLAYPTEGFGVVILGNDAAGLPGLLARRVAEACLGERMAPAAARAPDPSVEVVQARAGCYRSPDGDVISLVEQDGRLYVAGLPLPLSPLGPMTFVLGGDRDVFCAAFDAAGDGFMLSQASAPDRRYQRCEPPRDVDTEPFVGDYHSEEVGAGCEVQRAGDALAVSFARGLRAMLRPIGPDRLLAADFGATLSFRRGRDGAVQGFVIDGGRLRGVEYSRIRS